MTGESQEALSDVINANATGARFTSTPMPTVQIIACAVLRQRNEK